MPPAISLIVCTDGARVPTELLEALARQVGLPEAGVELLLIYSGHRRVVREISTAAEQKLHRNWTVVNLCSPKPGKARAINLGLERSRADILAWTDDDITPEPEWLATLCRPLLLPHDHPEASDITGGVVTIATHLEQYWFTERHRLRLAETLSEKRQGFVGANLAFRRSVLKHVPCFDEELGPGALGFQEETLFVRQLEVADARGCFVTDARVVHCFDPIRLTRPSLLQSAEKTGRSTAYVTRHWEHEKPTFLWLRLLRKRLQLVWWRLRNRTGRDDESEGADDKELDLYQIAVFYKSLINEWRRPANYSRHGLERIELIPEQAASVDSPVIRSARTPSAS
ncbi:glycosyltransferase [Botrimarina mediterranea]|uniref:Glycosyl transferase family 2 n=1 Tax=Botrimarina mediterranea TaxID=2528022 RepID=A0A518KA56_9BACT|nr:glycosyltransferase family A protein [Botrimarina mediterranea]QDV74672.1 Glycosyl transferase family 2 [Botrimarina mediterranea]QDV79309.1 Glycosyl transferase family 2 [Planctomycetes bacterium K2D]